MHYLEGHFDSALGKMVNYLVPEHQYKSVHDLFNPHLFHDMLVVILHNIPDLTPHIDSLLATAGLDEGEKMGTGSGFVEMRVRNFTSLWHALQTALSYQGQEVKQISREDMFRMVKDYDLDILEQFLQHLFELLIKNRGAVEHITELPAEDQTAIRDFLQKAKDKVQQHRLQLQNKDHDQEERKKLEQQNMELRMLLGSKETDLQRIALEKLQLEDELKELREMDASKESHIDNLKKRLMGYEETDTLFQQKDEEIHKLNKALTELQVSNRLLTSDLDNEKNKLESRIAELQQINSDIQARLNKLTNNYQALTKQKQEGELSNKKVIANLKDKLKGQTDKICEMQNQIVQIRISRQLRQRQYNELWTNYQTLRSQSINQGNFKGLELKRAPSSGDFDKGNITPINHHHLRLGEQINQIDKFEQGTFEEQIMMFETGEDNWKKIQQILNENNKLKEKLASLESKDYRCVMQENDKLRKRLVVMKKRNEELENQRKDQLDLMVSAFENCLRSKPEY